MRVIVVDSCVASVWVLPDSEERHRYGAAVAQAGLTGSKQLIAPSIFQAECSYVLLKRGRAARWGEAKIAERAEVIDFFSVKSYAVQQRLPEEVISQWRATGPGWQTRMAERLMDVKK